MGQTGACMFFWVNYSLKFDEIWNWFLRCLWFVNGISCHSRFRNTQLMPICHIFRYCFKFDEIWKVFLRCLWFVNRISCHFLLHDIWHKYVLMPIHHISWCILWMELCLTLDEICKRVLKCLWFSCHWWFHNIWGKY